MYPICFEARGLTLWDAVVYAVCYVLHASM